MPKSHPSVPLRRRKKFQAFIFDWWASNRRDLPWRHTRDPYKILVSEVMLQQTQVLRVIAKYREFIDRYPSAKHLAKAKTSDVLRIWKGMGYNRRALYLKKAATVGNFPNNETELKKIPGIGSYTARAIMVFAYDADVAMVDTNIRQIITHFFFDDKPQKESVIGDVAGQLVPKGRSWEWHQALMDYGAVALLRNRTERKRRATKPFKNSDRYYRGRIIDILRIHSAGQKKLLGLVIKKYNIPEEYVLKILLSLEKDGLVVRYKGTVKLPD